MRNKVIKVKNLKEKEKSYDLNTVLLYSSDCLYMYNGTYKEEDGSIISLDKNDPEAEYRTYDNVETYSNVKVPIAYCEVFENNNTVIDLNDYKNKESNADEAKLLRLKKEEECKKLIRKISSNR